MKNLILFSFIALISCARDDTQQKKVEKPIIEKKEAEIIEVLQTFKRLVNLSSYKNTIFLTTLESRINKNENSIYAASLLFAWQNIKNEINEPLIKFSSKNLKLMNKSDSYRNVLQPDEFETHTSVFGEEIEATAYFKKKLPFSTPLHTHNTPLNFKNSDVESFGFNSDCRFANIVYYFDDENFAVKIIPKDKSHEIILIKSKQHKSSLSKYYNHYLKQSLIFKTDKKKWKHYLNHGDIVKIPIINFNIETNFKDIVNSNFQTKSSKMYKVIKAYQNTAFLLNEKGAIVKGYSEMAAEASSTAYEGEKPKPKKIFFDTDFVIFLKSHDADNPYFGLYVANTELMEPFITSTNN